MIFLSHGFARCFPVMSIQMKTLASERSGFTDKQNASQRDAPRSPEEPTCNRNEQL
uniref:Uncharacterized protein n=1 Tax=Anopheles atroparvus TaxID=41427 RepID=A0AAG5CX63_ANOAO